MFLAGGVLGLTAATALGEDLDSVAKKIEEAWNKHKSLIAKMSLDSRLSIGSSTVVATGAGSYEFLRHDGKLLSRLELSSTTVQKTGEEESKFEERMLSTSDGNISWTLVETGSGERRVIKSRTEPNQTGDPKDVLEYLRRGGAVALLPDDTVEGRKVYVVEVIFRQMPEFSAGKQRLSFDQDSGFLLRIVGFGPNDEPMSTMTYNDIKIDVPIDPQRFKFTPPEGVEVIDDTAPEASSSQPTTASQPASAPASRPAASGPAPTSQPARPPRP
jgi:outer membrane lipoprotein-sorting protein